MIRSKKTKQLLLISLAILATLFGVWRYMEYNRMHNPNREHPPMEITKNPKPFCIGRIMVNLPEGMYLNSPEITPHIKNILIYNQLNIKTQTDITLEEFNQIVAKRWAEMQTYTHDSYKDAYVQPSELHQIKENGWLLTFNHESMESNVRIQPNGENLFDIVVYYEAEGYLWDNGTMFTIKGKGTEADERIKGVILQSRYRANDNSTLEEAGICINGGFIASHYQSASERLEWVVDLPQYDMALVFIMGTDVRDKSMLERSSYQDLKPTFAEDNSAIKLSGIVHRAASRADDYLPADELIVTNAQYDKTARPYVYDTEVYSAWEFKGNKNPNAQPYVEFNMVFDTKVTRAPKTLGDYPEQTETSKCPSKEEFMALWDSIVSTIRFRPNALAPAPVEPPKELVRSPSAQQRGGDKQALDDFLGEG